MENRIVPVLEEAIVSVRNPVDMSVALSTMFNRATVYSCVLNAPLPGAIFEALVVNKSENLVLCALQGCHHVRRQFSIKEWRAFEVCTNLEGIHDPTATK